MVPPPTMKTILGLLALLGVVVLAPRAGVADPDKLFVPAPTLAVEPDGEYTLRVVTLTPSTCYSAGRVLRGPPPNVRLTPDTLPVRVTLKARRRPCRQVATPVRHTLRNLKLGASGKTQVLVFATVNDRVVGSASVAAPAKPPAAGTAVDTSDWYAWVDRMPPGPASFHVTGVVSLPSPGYEARLVVSSPQGINPAQLILDLVVTPKPGIWPQVITAATVRHDRSDYDGGYTSVLIREPDGDATQTAVEEVY